MVRYSRDEKIDYGLYEHYLRQNGNFIRYNQNALKAVASKMSYESGVWTQMARDVMIQRSCGKYQNLFKEAIISYLQRFERCPEHYFFNRHTQGESLDQKKCLEPLLANGYATEFITYYMNSRSLAAKSSKLEKMVSKCKSEDAMAKDGTLLSRIPFTINKKANSRYNYSDYDIITQIPKEFASCVGVEDGYVLVWGDFAQSDFRIAYNIFLRSEENDKIMMKYADKYEALARMICLQNGTEFDLDKFKSERQLYKRLTLASIYGTSSSIIKEEQDFIKMINAFLDKCPRYVEYRERLRLYHMTQLPIMITSYFGDEETTPHRYDMASTVFRGLNAPIQKGTSEIVILTVCKILQRFYDLGYTEEDISVYYVRHDEPIFKVKESVLDDAWIFKDFDTILVGGWSPLEMEFRLGYWYNTPDEKLMRKYEEVCKHNESKIKQLSAEMVIEDYFPVAKAVDLIVYPVPIDTGDENSEGFTVVAILNRKEEAVHFMLVGTRDFEQCFSAIANEIINKIKFDDGVGIVIVHNTMKDWEYSKNGRFFKFAKSHGNEYFGVSSLAIAMATKYCNANEIKTDKLSELTGQQQEFVKSITNKIEVIDDGV